eukprot:7023796-Prymnesium_polylepis.1
MQLSAMDNALAAARTGLGAWVLARRSRGDWAWTRAHHFGSCMFLDGHGTHIVQHVGGRAARAQNEKREQTIVGDPPIRPVRDVQGSHGRHSTARKD